MSDIPDANATNTKMTYLINQSAKFQKFNTVAVLITIVVMGSIAVILVVVGQIQKALKTNTEQSSIKNNEASKLLDENTIAPSQIFFKKLNLPEFPESRDRPSFPASVGFYPLIIGIPMLLFGIIGLISYKKYGNPVIDTIRDARIISSSRLMGVTK